MALNHPRHIVAVSALVRRTNGDVLLINSPKRGWEFPGGQVENGENIVKALQREIVEETGVEANVGTLVGIYSSVSPPAKVIFGFLAEYAGGAPIPTDESLETRWFSRQEALRIVSNPPVLDRLRDMFNYGGRTLYRAYSIHPYQVHDQRTL